MKRVAQERSRRAAKAPVPTPKVGPSPKPPPTWDRRTWLVTIPLALIVLYAFLPSLDNGFVTWDDDENFVGNPHFRGLGPAQLKCVPVRVNNPRGNWS